jgi:hypothetical protein
MMMNSRYPCHVLQPSTYDSFARQIFHESFAKDKRRRKEEKGPASVLLSTFLSRTRSTQKTRWVSLYLRCYTKDWSFFETVIPLIEKTRLRRKLLGSVNICYYTVTAKLSTRVFESKTRSRWLFDAISRQRNRDNGLKLQGRTVSEMILMWKNLLNIR